MEYVIDEELVKHTKEKYQKQKKISESEKLSIDDLILLAFANIDENVFDGSKEKINNLFYDLKQNYPEYFKELHFMTCEDFPFSKELEQIFSRFQQSQAISIKNPLYKRFEMNEKTKNEIKNKLSKRQRPNNQFDSKIKEISKEIREKLTDF